MNHTVLLFSLLCLVSPAAAPRASAAVQLNYTLYVLGVHLGDAGFNMDLVPTGYGVSMRFATAGIADFFASDRVEEHVTGNYQNGRPVPIDYGSTSQFRGQDRLVGLVWHDGNPAVTQIVPPNATEREEVPPPLRLNTMDPLSAIVLMLHGLGQSGRCDASARTYDGRRLALLQATTAGEEEIPPSGRSSFAGRALRCNFTEQTLAGFRLGSGRDEDAKERRGTIWLAAITPGGPRLPVRATIETRWFGDASVYLTSAVP